MMCRTHPQKLTNQQKSFLSVWGGFGAPRYSQLTADEQFTVMSLWAVFRYYNNFF